MFNFAVRITLPFSDLSGTVRAWSLKADKLLCYEHDNTDRVHCHLLLLNTSVDAERLKQISKQAGVEGKGNTFWSFKTKSKNVGPITPETSERYIIYMSKGQFVPKYVKGYEHDYLDSLREQWSDDEPAVSKERLEYEAFEGEVADYCRLDHPEDAQIGTYILRYDKADVLVKIARRYAFAKASRIWNVRTASMAKSFFLTYAMRHNLQIDENKYKVW